MLASVHRYIFVSLRVTFPSLREVDQSQRPNLPLRTNMLESNQSPKRKPVSVNSASSWLHSDSNDLGVCPHRVMVHWESCSEMHQKLSVGMMFANYNQSNSCFSQCHRKGLQVDLGYVLTFRQQCRFHIGLAQESKADVTRSQEGMGLYTNVCQQILSPGQDRRSGLLVLCLNLFEYIYYCTHIS